MSKSARLRAEDWRAIFRVIGECRDLGDDRVAWREHLLGQATRLTGSDIGMTGEMADGRSLRPRDLGVVTWGWQTGFAKREVFNVHLTAFLEDPDYAPSMVEVFRHRANRPSVIVARNEIIEDRHWYRSIEYTLIAKTYGIDPLLYSFRAIPGDSTDEDIGLTLARSEGHRNYNGRERALVDELLSAAAPLVGGALARFSEPSPSDLTPRRRQVLACLLEGDGDKQIAKRMGLSLHTVNEHTKAIFRHFGVRSRPELLARWVRRGWVRPPLGIETAPAVPDLSKAASTPATPPGRRGSRRRPPAGPPGSSAPGIDDAGRR